jgi:hypothetical protein
MLGLGLRLWLPRLGSAASGAAMLIGAETNGVAIDFSDMSVVVRDTITPANDFTGDPNAWLTYSGPSTKWIENAAGLLVSGTTLRTEYAAGVPLGARMEEARTNLAVQSDDFTQAVWVKTTLTATLTATGADGVANSASTLTATAANAMALQTIVSASAARATSAYVKRRTGSGVVEMTQDGGALWTAVTVTAGWTRVRIPSATVTNPIVGFRLATSGDAIDVQFFQCESGTFATSPIRTTTATVTRSNDDVFRLVASMPYSASLSTLYSKMRPLPGTDASSKYVSLVDASSAKFIGFAVPSFVVTDTSNQALITFASWPAGTVHKIAGSAQANLFKAAMDAVAGLDDTAGTMPTGITHCRLSGLLSTFAVGNFHVEQTAYFPRAFNTAELAAITT